MKKKISFDLVPSRTETNWRPTQLIRRGRRRPLVASSHLLARANSTGQSFARNLSGAELRSGPNRRPMTSHSTGR